MAGTRRLSIEIVGDAKGVAKAFGDAGDSADGFGSKLGGVAKKAGVAVLGIGTAALGAAAVFGPAILEQGAALEALGVKAETVFGDNLGQVEEWSAANAKAMGLTAKQATGLAAGMGDLLKPMGFTSDQAAEMSTGMLDLSGALSAWSGGQVDAAGVSDILTKAMLGERDGLKTLGISISEADVQARLAANGTDQLTGAALEQAKAVATQQLIMEKSTDAQTAWANGSMASVQSQNAMKASIDTAKEALITGLYPAFQALVPIISAVAGWLGEHLPAAMAVVQTWVAENWPLIKEGIMSAVDAVRGGIEGFITFIGEAWSTWGDEIMAVVDFVFPVVQRVIGGTLETIRGVIKTVTSLITGDWGGAWNGIKGIVSGVWDAIKAVVGAALTALGGLVRAGVDEVVGFVLALPGKLVGLAGDMLSAGAKIGSSIIGGIGDGIRNAAGAIGDVASAILNAFKKGWNDVAAKINNFIPDKVGFDTPFGYVGVDLPDNPIPKFHSGGQVGGRSFAGMAPDEVAAILQRGETVLTGPQLSAVAGGGAGVTVIVQADATTDKAAIGQAIIEAIQAAQRTNGRVFAGV